MNKRKSHIFLKQDCNIVIICWGCYKISVDSSINDIMIDVHGAGEFNVPDDTNNQVVGIPHCVIY